MKALKLLLLAALLAASSGCTTKPKVVDGVNLALGAYIPYDGGIYGLSLVEYTSGCVVKSLPTNCAWSISREYAATNSWFFGFAKTVEHTKLDVKVE